jgi:hypothetical protein
MFMGFVAILGYKPRMPRQKRVAFYTKTFAPMQEN